MFTSFQSAMTFLDSQDPSEIVKTGYEMTSSTQDSGMNPIRPQLVGIKLEHILHEFRVSWKLIMLAAMVLQLRALRPSWSVILKDRSKEYVKHLYFVPVCEVTILTL
ncbi:hypothetical protein BTVI_64524 [Pitangus sulphuratus]|nr:hypothetical protein BTVI_64524 [Pitangus sulphuratus]